MVAAYPGCWRRRTLEFEALTQAGALARLRLTQRRLVDGFVEQAIEATANDRRVGKTLFELLVPNDFKPYAPDQNKLALMLNADGGAALGADARWIRPNDGSRCRSRAG